MKRLATLLVVVAVSASFLAGCARPTPEVVEKEVVVEKPVVQTVVVEKEKVVEKPVIETVIVEKQIVVEKEVVVTPTPQPFKPKGEMVIALTTEINSLEQPYAQERNSINASWTLYDSLLTAPWYGPVEPGLAESWEISEDGTEYILHLRKDVVFHNGDPFTAEDVVFSWETYSQEGCPKRYHWTLAETVEAIDEYTLRITTSAPNALLLTTMGSEWLIVPKKYYQEVGQEGFTEHPIGTGPFMFQEWVRGDHVTVVANPNYWRENSPKLEKITFKPIPDSSTRVAALQTGQIDLATRLTAEEAQRLMGDPNIRIIRYVKDRPCYISFNNLSTGLGTPIIDPKVRLAMNYAVDVQAIVDAIFNGFAQPSTGFVTPANVGFDNADPFPYDPEKARQLLAEAGYPDGFKIDMACPDQAYVHINEVCEAVVGYLADVGIEADLEIMESNHFWDLQKEKTAPPIFIDCWGGASNEAYARLKAALTKEEIWSMWYDETLANMVAEIPSIIDFDERMERYAEIQQYMREDPPFAYLHLDEAFEAVNSRIVGYEPFPNEKYLLWNVSIREE